MKLKIAEQEKSGPAGYQEMSLWRGTDHTYILIKHWDVKRWAAYSIDFPGESWNGARDSPQEAVDGLAPAPRTVLVWE